MKALTEKQMKVYEFVVEFTQKAGYPPSVREICAHVGYKSPSSAHFALVALEEHGLITRDGRKTRSISVSGGPAAGIPILGAVAAGSPILAVEDALGYLPYDAGDSGESFALCIHGNSMINAGILDGDMVVVRRQQSARTGEIVVALIGDEATCKRLDLRRGHVWLLPENDDYDPIDGDSAQILGKVTAVIRTY